MAQQLLLRALQAVPVYLTGVLLLLGVAQVFAGPSQVMAAPVVESAPTQAAPAFPVRVTILLGPISVPVLLPTEID